MGKYLEIVRKLEEALRYANAEQGQPSQPYSVQFAKLLEYGEKSTKYLAENTGASESSCRVILNRRKDLFAHSEQSG